MSLGSESGIPAVMNVTPTNANGNGGWGGDWSSWLVVFILFACFGFGGFGGFGMGGWGMGGMMGGYPVESILQRSLDTQTIIGKLDGVNQGICNLGYDQLSQMNNISSQLASGFAGIGNAICNSEYQNAQLVNGINTNMMQGFNAQNVAYLQGQNALQMQLADCCCKTNNNIERGFADVGYRMATDTCAVTTAIANSTRDVLENANSNSRAILDALNQNYIRTLESENQSLKLSASQAQQNAAIGAMISASEATILRRTGAECPTPAYVVQPPTPVNFPTNCCGQFAGWNNGGCGSC